MARKNLIGVSNDPAPQSSTATPMPGSRPIAGFVPPGRPASPIGGITKSLSSMASKMERAQDLEKQLAQGHAVVDLDPDTIDNSFVSDRLELDRAALDQLVEQIREHGQQVPILVRPNPQSKGRYQVAYGHRRLAAVRQLGKSVRAVVRELSDEQLVVSQGQENNARTNLSYIERAVFASKLEDREFTRDIIMSALGVDKAALSKMLSVTKQVPLQLVEAIGPAPEVGRRRWMELSERLDPAQVPHLVKFLTTETFRAKTSDERFQAIVEEMNRKLDSAPRAAPEPSWIPNDKLVSVRVTTSAKRAVIALEARDGTRFAKFITSRLDGLYEAFRQEESKKTGD